MAVESLSEMFEKPTTELSGLKVDMMDKTSYCNKRRVILLEDTAVNLKMGKFGGGEDGFAANGSSSFPSTRRDGFGSPSKDLVTMALIAVGIPMGGGIILGRGNSGVRVSIYMEGQG
ncbi:MAG: hypothetical protein Q9183_002948 [Haloplaca sp. 2 TL-2023]